MAWARKGGGRPHLARLAIFLAVSAAAIWLMLAGPAVWRWPLGLGLWVAGGLLAEAAFRRLAGPAQIRRDLRERVDSID